MTSITFLGAARTVTGSKYLLDTGASQVLIDAGLFQGLKELRERNWQPLPIPAADIDAIVLTHAHLDHCGYLPRLVAQGFRGRVFCTAGHARSLPHRPARCRTHPGRGRGATPTGTGSPSTRRRCRSTPKPTRCVRSRSCSRSATTGRCRSSPDVEVEFINAGHLLGSAYARVRTGGHDDPVRRRSRPVRPAGAARSLAGRRGGLPARRIDLRQPRARCRTTTAHGWRESSSDTSARGGRIIIPSFAIGRVEELIYWLRRLEEEQRIPVLPVFVDSPMAIEALSRYQQRLAELDPELQPESSR